MRGLRALYLRFTVESLFRVMLQLSSHTRIVEGEAAPLSAWEVQAHKQTMTFPAP